MKQTAVEFLIETLAKNGVLHSSDISKAKAMEKSRIIEAHLNAQGYDDDSAIREAEQYYNETYSK